MASTAVCALVLIALKAVTALVVAWSNGIPVELGWWRGWFPVVSVNAVGPDFAHVITMSTVATGIFAGLACVVGAIFAHHREVLWPSGTFLAVPMAVGLVAFEWLRFGTHGVLDLQLVLRMVAGLGLAGLFFLFYGMRSYDDSGERSLFDLILQPVHPARSTQ